MKMMEAAFRRPRRALRMAVAAAAVTLIGGEPARAQDKLQVVATLPTYAAIAREVTGDLAEVEAIARGDEDPHFVSPRPSFAALVGDADLFVVTGLDLEVWIPAILDRARNAKVVEGGPGNVAAYSGVTLLQVPADVSRAGGDVHVFGNPHVHTDPVNGILVARNILAGLERIDPANATAYEANFDDFKDRVLRRTYGDQLVEMLGADVILQLARNYELWDFLRGQEFQGKPLTDYLGGWMAEAAPFRDHIMACYHKNWAYFSERFRIACAIYIEPKPGIPATPGHLTDVVSFMEEENVGVLFAANYFSQSQVERVASRTGARAVIVPEHVEGLEGIDTYFDLFDYWISHLSNAFLAMEQPPAHRED
jgi:ABC-type Zn uptake system ZnuABC Zn-binding protein ZnuA